MISVAAITSSLWHLSSSCREILLYLNLPQVCDTLVIRMHRRLFVCNNTRVNLAFCCTSFDLSSSRFMLPVNGIIKHLYMMIILNTVGAWLANYSTHYFPCIFWIIAMFSFFSKTMETFSIFCLGESAESPLFAVHHAPASSPLLF